MLTVKDIHTMGYDDGLLHENDRSNPATMTGRGRGTGVGSGTDPGIGIA